MIKAIFFDWFNTLARYEPPREELHSQVLHGFGIELSPDKLIPAVLVADRYFFEENAISPVGKRSREEQAEAYIHYTEIMLNEVGVKPSKELLLDIFKKGQRLFGALKFILFDDTLPTLKTLKERKFILGSLTNYDKDMASICHELGVDPYLDFVVTSGEVGVDKPRPPIFLKALEKANVEASEAVHVGDQYQIDVTGARGVGITPILIDRYNLYPEVTDCRRIKSLTELAQFL